MSAETQTGPTAEAETAMDMPARRESWSAFMRLVQWSSALLLLLLAYPVMTISAGVHWLVALSSLLILGFIANAVMNMGRSFNLTLVGLAALAVLIQVFITIFQALL